MKNGERDVGQVSVADQRHELPQWRERDMLA